MLVLARTVSYFATAVHIDRWRTSFWGELVRHLLKGGKRWKEASRKRTGWRYSLDIISTASKKYLQNTRIWEVLKLPYRVPIRQSSMGCVGKQILEAKLRTCMWTRLLIRSTSTAISKVNKLDQCEPKHCSCLGFFLRGCLSRIGSLENDETWQPAKNIRSTREQYYKNLIFSQLRKYMVLKFLFPQCPV